MGDGYNNYNPQPGVYPSPSDPKSDQTPPSQNPIETSQIGAVAPSNITNNPADDIQSAESYKNIPVDGKVEEPSKILEAPSANEELSTVGQPSFISAPEQSNAANDRPQEPS